MGVFFIFLLLTRSRPRLMVDCLQFLCRVVMAAIHQLPYDEVLRIHSKALFSKQEEDVLSTVTTVRRA